MKIDPSSQVPDYSAPSPTVAEGQPAPPQPKKTVFPDITLRGDEAAKLMAQFKAGDTFQADVTFKVTEHRSRSGGSKQYMSDEEANSDSIELEIQGLEVEDGPDDKDDDSAESAVDAYQASKAAPPEED